MTTLIISVLSLIIMYLFLYIADCQQKIKSWNETARIISEKLMSRSSDKYEESERCLEKLKASTQSFQPQDNHDQ